MTIPTVFNLSGSPKANTTQLGTVTKFERSYRSGLRLFANAPTFWDRSGEHSYFGVIPLPGQPQDIAGSVESQSAGPNHYLLTRVDVSCVMPGFWKALQPNNWPDNTELNPDAGISVLVADQGVAPVLLGQFGASLPNELAGRNKWAALNQSYQEVIDISFPVPVVGATFSGDRITAGIPNYTGLGTYVGTSNTGLVNAHGANPYFIRKPATLHAWKAVASSYYLADYQRSSQSLVPLESQYRKRIIPPNRWLLGFCIPPQLIGNSSQTAPIVVPSNVRSYNAWQWTIDVEGFFSTNYADLIPYLGI